MPILNLNFPLKIAYNLFPGLKYLQPKFTPIDYSTYSPIDVPFIEQPFLYILLISLPDLKIYKSNTRPLIQSWLKKMSYIEGERAIMIYSENNKDNTSTKAVDKVRHDISVAHHNKCHVYTLSSDTFKHADKFIDLIIACLVARREHLEDSYNIMWSRMIQTSAPLFDFKQIFSTSENLASFYMQTCEYAHALKIYDRLAVSKGTELDFPKFLNLFVDISQTCDLDQPTIILSDKLYACVDELTNQQKSYLYFSQYRLGMALQLYRLIGSSNQNTNCLKDCLEFITSNRRLMNGVEPAAKVHRWFLKTTLELANSCITTALSAHSLSTPINDGTVTGDKGEKVDVENSGLLQEYRLLGMLYSHAYFLSKLESDEVTIGSLRDTAINYFEMGGYHRFSKALSLLDDASGCETGKWVSAWDLPYPPFICLDVSFGVAELSNMPFPTQIYNTFNNTAVPLQFFCPLITAKSVQPMPLTVELTFLSVTKGDVLIKSNVLVPVGGSETDKFRLKESLILPEGMWLLKFVAHYGKILYPRDIASTTLSDMRCFDNLSLCSFKCIIKVTCPLSLKMYSDKVIETLDCAQWVCGHDNYIEFTSIVDPFELISPIPLVLIDPSNGNAIGDSESYTYRFNAGSYKFLVDCHIAERFVGHVVMKSCDNSTMIKTKIAVFPLFEINVHYMSELFLQLEITALKSINMQLQIGAPGTEGLNGPDGKGSPEIRSFPPLIPLIPFYVILDGATKQCEHTLIMNYENKTYKFRVDNLLGKQNQNQRKLGVRISASDDVGTGEPFAVSLYGSESEAVACEFEDSDDFILVSLYLCSADGIERFFCRKSQSYCTYRCI